jgi:hypothetical protein
MEHAIPWTGNRVDQGHMQIYDFPRVFRKWSEGSGGCKRTGYDTEVNADNRWDPASL